MLLLGRDVHHKTLGIIGFGRIGQAVAKGHGLRMKILYYDVNQMPEVARRTTLSIARLTICCENPILSPCTSISTIYVSSH